MPQELVSGKPCDLKRPINHRVGRAQTAKIGNAQSAPHRAAWRLNGRHDRKKTDDKEEI